jgi:DNA-directed RNA polymerase alpha subunit
MHREKNMPISTLEMGYKSRKALRHLGVKTIDDLLSLDPDSILSLDGMGNMTRNRVVALCKRVIEDLNKSAPVSHAKPASLEIAWSRIYSDLSVRARNGLSRLSVVDAESFLNLSQEEFLSERAVGKKTWAEIVAAQSRLVRQDISKNDSDVVKANVNSLDLYPLFSGWPLEMRVVPDEFFPATPVHSFVINVRARGALKKLGVETLGELLFVLPEDLQKLRNCGKQTVQELRRAIRDLVDYKRGHEQTVCFEKNFRSLIVRLCSEVGVSKRNTEVVAQRICDGSTLEEIANKFKCTRERIRQIVAKAVKHIEEFIKTQTTISHLGAKLSEIVDSYCGIIGANQLGALISQDLGWDPPLTGKAIKELLRNFSFIGKQVSFDGKNVSKSHPCRECQHLMDGLEATVKSSDNETIDVASVMERFQRLCKDRTIFGCEHQETIISDELLSELCCQLGFKRYGSKICSANAHALATGGLLKRAEAYLYINKGVHSEEEIQEALKASSGDTCDRLRPALLSSSECLRWGKDTFIHQRHVKVSSHVLEIIRNEVETQLAKSDFASVAGIFNEYRFTFLDEGILSNYALASLISHYFGNIFYVDHYRYIHSEKPNSRTSLNSCLEKWLLDQGRAVSLEDIKSKIINDFGAKEGSAGFYINQSDEIIPLEDKSYVHADNFCEKSDLEPFEKWIEAALGTNKQVGARRLFDDCSIACFQLGIRSAKTLYFIMRYFYSDQFDFPRFPHISRQGRDALSLNAAIEKYLLEQNGIVSVEQCAEHFGKLGYSQVQIKARLPSIENTFFYYPKCVVHADVIGWDDNKKNVLLRILESSYCKSLESGWLFGDLQDVFDLFEDDLPELDNYVWTGELLASVASTIGPVCILGTAKRVYIIKGLDQGKITSLGDLVCEVVSTVFKGGCSRGQLSDWMKENGVVRKRLTPSMFPKIDGLVMTEHECYLTGRKG